MTFGFEFCLSKSSKISKRRGATQHQSNQKNTDADIFQSNDGNTNGINDSNRNSQHSLNLRDLHTTPKTTTTTTTTATVPSTHPILSSHPEVEHNNQKPNSFKPGIRHVTTKFYAQAQDELAVGPGDVCILIEPPKNDYQGKSWSHVLCLTQNNAQGFVPSEILSTHIPEYLVQYKKKIQRSCVDHSSDMHLNPRRHHSQRHSHLDDLKRHHHQQHESNNHNNGPHHASVVAPAVISNAAIAGLISRVPQCEVDKIGQCVSDKTCLSNGDSIRYPPSAHVDLHNHLAALPPDHHRSRLDIHPNQLHGSSSGCQTFQKYPEPAFPMNGHFDPASYYNLNGPVPEQPYGSFRSKCTLFSREYPGDLYIVMFSFVHHEERDIGVKPGDYVYVLNKDDINWYWVRREEDNLEGFVPSRFIVPNDIAEFILNKGNSTVTMKSSNAIESHTYINSNPVPDKESLQTNP